MYTWYTWESKWTVLYVLTGTVGRDRQKGLRCIHGTHGSQVDCPVVLLCPNWYINMYRVVGDRLYSTCIGV